MAICHNGKEGGLVSRRSFLKGGVAVGGAALVGGVLGGCSPQPVSYTHLTLPTT